MRFDPVPLAPWLAMCACSPVPASPEPVAPPAIVAIEDTDVEPAAPGWHYHPTEMATVKGGWQLVDDRWLLVGELGERWLTTPVPKSHAKATVTTFRAHASEHRAPEELTHVVKLRAGRGWLFVDATGGTYTATTPLGPLMPQGRAPEPLSSIATTKRGAMGVNALGAGYRWHDHSWEPLSTALPIYELASGSDGVLLGLAFPEALHRSDDGIDWQRIDSDPFGADALWRRGDGQVVVSGAHDDRLFSHGALNKLDGDTSPLPTEAGIDIQPLLGPRASAIEQQTAVLSGSRYYELFEESDDDQPRWMLTRGKLGSALETIPFAVTDECQATLLAAAGRHVLVACGQQHGDPIDVHVHRSKDGGSRFDSTVRLRANAHLPAAMAIAPDGRALITGMCDARQRPCVAQAPLHLHIDGTLTATKAPELVKAGSSPAFSHDGQRAYFLGERGKDDKRALFVSDDGGKTFDARPLSVPKRERSRLPHSSEASAILPGRDGYVGVLFGSEAYAIAEPTGRITSVARLPVDTVAIGGSGRFILTVAEQQQRDDATRAQLFESTDAGMTFRPVAAPMSLLIDEFERNLSLACSSTGCLIGDRLTRVGWNAPSASLVARREAAPTEFQPAVRTPMVCQLTSDRDWTQIDHLAETSPLPTANQMMRGSSMWSVLRHDDVVGEVTVVTAELASNDVKVRSQSLFSPVRKRQRWAYHVAPQMEGYAAMRAPLPAKHAGKPMTNLEVAWVNHLTGRNARAVIQNAGVFSRNDVTPGDRPALVAGLLSVSPNDAFVRPSQQRTDTFVVSHDGLVVHRHRYPSWPATGHPQSYSDAVMAEGQPLAVAMFYGSSSPNPTTAALASLNTPGDASFISLAPTAPVGGERYVETSWTYDGNQVGIMALLLDRRGMQSRGWFTPFRGDRTLGQVIALPTQPELPSEPRPCSADDRSNSPRVNAPSMVGTRHPVLVQGSVETHTLLTERAVLHGGAGNPCVAAWHATKIGHHGSHVAVISGDLQHAWLFKSPAHGVLAYRPMSCQLSPQASVPPAVFTEGGTVRLVP